MVEFIKGLNNAPLNMPVKNIKAIEIVLAATQNGYALKYASEDLRGDKEVVLAAVANSGGLQYAADELTVDREFVLVANNMSMH